MVLSISTQDTFLIIKIRGLDVLLGLAVLFSSNKCLTDLIKQHSGVLELNKWLAKNTRLGVANQVL